MLVLSRKVGEEIVINDNIRVTVLAIRANQVRLGITAPGDVPIYREELLQTEGRTLATSAQPEPVHA
jgi:carbon storage regulator